MMRVLAGGVAALLLVGSGVFWWQASAHDQPALAAAPAAGSSAPSFLASPRPDRPPEASQATREEKRFQRYDKDRNGSVSRDEYLATRRKAWAKLDADGDGKLSFDEWAAKSEGKFIGADADKSGLLTAAEFETTRIVHKPRADCPPPAAKDDDT